MEIVLVFILALLLGVGLFGLLCAIINKWRWENIKSDKYEQHNNKYV